MKTVLLILPDQLFKEHQGLQHAPDSIFILEEPLYFGIRPSTASDQSHFPKHRQKLVFHRASMQAYADYLRNADYQVEYIDASAGLWPTVFQQLSATATDLNVLLMDPVNTLIKSHVERHAAASAIAITWLSPQHFINSSEENAEYRSQRKRWFMADFYQAQRKKLDILMDEGKPLGGKWSFDTENRKKIPKAKRADIPQLNFPNQSSYVLEAQRDIEQRFPDALGTVSTCYYPIGFDDAEQWLEVFLRQRFSLFGAYEDALVPGQGWLYHSVLTPMLNTGLLTPQQVVKAVLDYVDQHPDTVPLASVEGFIRQIIGWREFMRATYEDLGGRRRSSNHWQHTRALPASFYSASTGIAPIDDVIERVLDTGYCHHIERLMVLGGFMFLCEIDPNDIYRWFTDMFIDAYDWVMVPNIYAMSQHADGGLITTKPYFSGSAYLKKMGYDLTGPWCEIWDGLYWRWIWLHKDQLVSNPRWAMMCRMAEKMDPAKMQHHLGVAEQYLGSLASD